jgi:hypothetical protein
MPEEMYADNRETKGIKLYFYLQKGVSILNEFKNLFMLIFAVYFALKLTSIIWLVVMFLVSLPILVLIGWYVVNHMSKVIEWLSIRHGTHYQIRQFTLVEETVSELKKITKLLETK